MPSLPAPLQRFDRGLRDKLKRYDVALDAWHLAHEFWWTLTDRRGRERARRWYDEEFARGDPWDYAGPEGRERHLQAIGVLDRELADGRVATALEVGC